MSRRLRWRAWWDTLPERAMGATVCRLRGHRWRAKMRGDVCGRCYTFRDGR